MNTNEIKELLKGNESRIFSVVFIKKDGTRRKMICRLGVKKHLHGGHNTVEHIEKYLTVYDMEKAGYRNINCETIEEIHMGGHSLSPYEGV